MSGAVSGAISDAGAVSGTCVSGAGTVSGASVFQARCVSGVFNSNIPFSSFFCFFLTPDCFNPFGYALGARRT